MRVGLMFLWHTLKQRSLPTKSFSRKFFNEQVENLTKLKKSVFSITGPVFNATIKESGNQFKTVLL